MQINGMSEGSKGIINNTAGKGRKFYRVAANIYWHMSSEDPGAILAIARARRSRPRHMH